MKQTYPSDLSQYATAADVIKHAIERSRYRSASAVNCETLSLYFGVGKFVSENSRTGFWGTKALASISVLLQRELPGLRGFSESALKRMRSFYEEWQSILILQPVGISFSWDDFIKISFSHHIEIITRTKDVTERLFYIHCAAQALHLKIS